ncbi:diacylglycerol/lipid kinase family protein [Galbitalea soli]|uniref:Diacylglycerol kinase n=1 Tax=Galbitalea soli TaxID=1268042 RepID=A0A7C9TRX3_9MICO|nr:diacylglycerol kinase family protein [Galbitalea soli]NEM92537.1 diacylglycerol kinase [Galbitalea soli]NYJ29574.1 diacylglycerol kinase family enzyme [Galbitalea soli]
MPTPSSPPERVAAIIVNPVKVDRKALHAAVRRAERAAGWSSSIWFETSVEDPGSGAARTALDRGVDVVVVAGGDGTLRAVAQELRGSAVPLALVPAGTGNLLARNLGLPLDNLALALRTAFAGSDRLIDVGVVEAERVDGTRDTHAFLVMAGLGLDAQMAANTNELLKARVGWLAYVDPIMRALRDNNSVRVRYQVDGRATRTATVNTVLIGNCGTLTAGITLLPDAAIDDGVLDIVAFRPKGLFGWAQIWVKIFWENGVLRHSTVGRKIISMSREVRALRYLKGTEVVMRLEHPEEFELDGDAFGEAIALKAHVEHLALRVRVPRG